MSMVRSVIPIAIVGFLLILVSVGGTVLADDQIRAHVVQKGDTSITVSDSAGRIVDLVYPVESVVVLWDNPAEMMIALGAGDKIVGIETATKDDADRGIYPSLVNIPVVGSQEEPNYEIIVDLKPDAVIMLSSYPPLPNEVAEKLEPFGIPVVALDFYRVEVWSDEIKTLGAIIGRENEAQDLLNLMNVPQAMITERVSAIPSNNRPVVYFEGAKDYLTYGGAGYGSGIPGLIYAAGAKDLFYEREEASFTADPEEVAKRNPG